MERPKSAPCKRQGRGNIAVIALTELLTDETSQQH
jgi:hypothetical protein